MIKQIVFIAAALSIHICTTAQTNSTVQAVAGLETFPNLRDYCLNSAGTEDFFTIQSPNGEISQIATRKKINGNWTAPQLLPFCDVFMYLEPFLSQDGLTLYFVSDRPLSDTAHSKKDFDIWKVSRTSEDAQWLTPVNLGAPVNSAADEFYPSLTSSGDLYFTKDVEDGMGKDDIYMCAFMDGKYSAPQILPEPINSAGYEFNAFITPDGNELIYTKYNAPGGYGSGDLYVAQKNPFGEWQAPVNMGLPLNTMYMEYCPYYHMATKTLYFTSRRSSLEAQEFKSTQQLLEYIKGNENGWSRLYYIPIE